LIKLQVLHRITCTARRVSGTWVFNLGQCSLLHNALHWLDVPMSINNKVDCFFFINCMQEAHALAYTSKAGSSQYKCASAYIPCL